MINTYDSHKTCCCLAFRNMISNEWHEVWHYTRQMLKSEYRWFLLQQIFSFRRKLFRRRWWRWRRQSNVGRQDGHFRIHRRNDRRRKRRQNRRRNRQFRVHRRHRRRGRRRPDLVAVDWKRRNNVDAETSKKVVVCVEFVVARSVGVRRLEFESSKKWWNTNSGKVNITS